MGDEPKTTEKLPEFLAEIKGMAEFPALSHSIEQVLLKVEEEASIQHITNVILKDYSLTLRILRTANSPLYNRSGRQIHSISHAVTLLGVEAVREMATGVVTAGAFPQALARIERIDSSLSLNRKPCTRGGRPGGAIPKREEAYLCGMFRNLGEVLIACYHPARLCGNTPPYSRQDQMPVAQACVEVLRIRLRRCAGKAVAARSGEFL